MSNSITLSVSSTVMIEKEVILPAYFKYGQTYIKVITPKKSVAVTTYEFHRNIEFYREVPGIVAQAEPSTEAEFKEAFASVMADIKKEEAAL